jgi:hypothetical protein
MKKAELLQKFIDLQAEFEQYKKESVKWYVEDFTMYKMKGWQINEEQAQEALERMIYKHDSNEGICWITIKHYLEQYGEEVEEGKEAWRQFITDEED